MRQHQDKIDIIWPHIVAALKPLTGILMISAVHGVTIPDITEELMDVLEEFANLIETQGDG